MAIKLSKKSIEAVAISMRQFHSETQICNALVGIQQTFYRVYGDLIVEIFTSGDYSYKYNSVGIRDAYTGLHEWVGDMQNHPCKAVFTDKKKAEKLAEYCKRHGISCLWKD